MNGDTLRALHASITKWQANAQATSPDEAKLSATDCPLCNLFFDNSPLCNKCPVRAHTGLPGCRDTPYEDADFAYDQWLKAHNSEEARNAFRLEAEREVAFLQSLLPPEANDG